MYEYCVHRIGAEILFAIVADFELLRYQVSSCDLTPRMGAGENENRKFRLSMLVEHADYTLPSVAIFVFLLRDSAARRLPILAQSLRATDGLFDSGDFRSAIEQPQFAAITAFQNRRSK
jgi:hypothetical protein